jgi:cytochrome c556
MLFSSPRWRAGACLAVGALLAALTVARSQEREPEPEVLAARKDVVAFADKLAAWKEITPKELAAFHRKHEELLHAMTVFKPRRRGGLGVGPAGASDGIEARLLLLEKKALAPRQLRTEKKDLLRMGYVIKAVAEATRPDAPKRDRAIEWEWEHTAEEMKAGADAFIAAVYKEDARTVRRAASQINATCQLCHADFRNGPGPRRGVAARFAVEAAGANLVKLAARVAAGKEVAPAEARDHRARHRDLDYTMWTFKDRSKGGLGVGPTGAGDGIEATLLSLSRAPRALARLKSEQADLAKMATIIRTVAQVASTAPPRWWPGADNHWRTYAASLDAEAASLARAVAAANPAAVRRAAEGVRNACGRCHIAYRDRKPERPTPWGPGGP